MKARTNILTSIVSMGLVGMLLLTACSMIPQVLPGSGGAGKPPTQIPAATGGAIPATGGQPSVTVNDQASDGSSVVVAKVVSKGPGWIAIHTQQNGQMGEVIGYTPVKDGENDNVTVKIDPTKATPTMYAMLHVDAGVVGKYEFPGPDVPYMSNGQMVSPSFHITMGAASGATPSVTIKDQDVSGGKVVVDDVVSSGPGWVDIHVQKPDGSMGPEIGFSAVHNGDNKNVTITIDASKATGTMSAMLHVDAGTPGVFENPGPDTTVTLNGQMVGVSFKNSTSSTAVNSSANAGSSMPGMAATEPAGEYANQPTGQPTGPGAATPTQMQGSGYGSSQPTATASGGGTGMAMATPSGGAMPLVKVSDQQIQNGMVKIDDVMSQGPGWIVVYTVKNGQPDQPIGETHVNDGDNQNVMVKIDTTKGPVDTLYAQLHVDAGTIGTFEFPGPDAPVMLGVQMISGLFKTNVNAAASAPTPTSAPTPMVTVKDQGIHNGAVVVAHIVAIGDSWIVIHPQNPDGSMGDMIGATAIHDGANDNVIVHIDTSRATRTMYAMLHVNVSKASYPQFPGVDVPVMLAGKMVSPAFNITGSLYGDIPLAVNKNSAGVSYLTDGLGMTLYLSLSDQPGVSNCTGDCLKQWHPLLATGAINAGTGVSVAKIGVIFLPDRTRQVTYNGSPLYYFVGDQVPGDTKGQGVGGNWFLVAP